MDKKDQEAIKRHKRVELLAMGIDPSTFYHAHQFLNRALTFVYKPEDDEYFIFGQGSSMDDLFGPRRRWDVFEISNLLEYVFGLTELEADKMTQQWIRERILYHYMVGDTTKHWDLLNVGLPYIDDDDKDLF